MKIPFNYLEGGALYSLFFVLAYFTCFVLLIWEGKKRESPIVPWVLLVCTGVLFFIIGCKLAVFTKTDWQLLFTQFTLPKTQGKSVLGGIFLAIPLVLIVKNFLSLNKVSLNLMAFILPIGMTLQRFGCLMAGCCYGKPTEMPWGLAYAKNTPVHNHHFGQHWIASRDHSLAVHPIPFYEIVSCLLIIYVLLKVRSWFKKDGSLLLTSVLLYAIFRFINEFFRDSTAHVVGGTTWWGMNTIQWGLVLIMIVISYAILFRERKSSILESEIDVTKTESTKQWKNIFVFILLSLMSLLLYDWLSLVESITFLIILFITYAALAWQVYLTFTKYLPKWLSLGLLVLLPLTMAQTFIPQKDSLALNNKDYWSFGIGGATGSHDMFIESFYSDCSGNNITDSEAAEYDVSYSLMGLGIERSLLEKDGRLNFGANVLFGTQNETVTGDIAFSDKIRLFNVNPYLSYDWPKVGLKGGFHIGNVSNLAFFLEENGEPPISQVKLYSVLPSFNFRFGRLSNLYFETGFMADPYTTLAGSSVQYKLAHGLGLNNNTAIKIGTTMHNGLLLEAQVPIKKRFLLNAHLAGFSGFMNEYTEQSHFRGSLELRYRW